MHAGCGTGRRLTQAERVIYDGPFARVVRDANGRIRVSGFITEVATGGGEGTQVTAPGTRVDVGGNGTTVEAPFTRVNTTGNTTSVTAPGTAVSTGGGGATVIAPVTRVNATGNGTAVTAPGTAVNTGGGSTSVTAPSTTVNTGNGSTSVTAPGTTVSTGGGGTNVTAPAGLSVTVGRGPGNTTAPGNMTARNLTASALKPVPERVRMREDAPGTASSKKRSLLQEVVYSGPFAFVSRRADGQVDVVAPGTRVNAGALGTQVTAPFSRVNAGAGGGNAVVGGPLRRRFVGGGR